LQDGWRDRGRWAPRFLRRRSAIRRPVAAIALTVAIAAIGASPSTPAVADADPASDVLAIQDVFLPYTAPRKQGAEALGAAVDRIYANGYRIKVAVIASAIDLGALGGIFWNQPGHYAKFLGNELSFLFVGPLLIVMPVGFGIYDGGRSTAAEKRVLAGLSVPGPGSDPLTDAATTAVGRLLAAGALRSKDVLRPRATAYPASVRRGKLERLSYAVQDDSDRARVVLSISAGAKKLATFRLPLQRLHRRPGSFSLEWRVPKRVPRRNVRFCIVARDPGGNASPRTCVPLSIR
jgi:hypothetical protein